MWFGKQSERCSSGKKLRHCESFEDLVGSLFEYSRERFLDERNKVLTQDFKVLIDGKIDDIAECFLAPEEILEINRSLLHRYLDFHFVDDEMCLSVDLLVNPLDPHVTLATCEVSVEMTRTFDRKKKNFPIDVITPDDEQMRQLKLESILGGVLNDAVEMQMKKMRKASGEMVILEIFKDPIWCAESFDVVRRNEKPLTSFAAGYN